MRDELSRAYAFLARGDMGGTREVESPFGRAVYTDELPRRLDGNYLWVDRDAEPEELVAEAARLERRLIFVPDPAIGDSLAPWFKERGWRIDRHVVMVQLHEPEIDADLSLVREVDERDQREARRRVLANEPWASPEVLDQIFAAKARIGERVTGPLGADDVQVPDGRMGVVEERWAEAGFHHAFCAAVADELFECGSALEVTHPRAYPRGRASRARRCRGGRRDRPSSR